MPTATESEPAWALKPKAVPPVAAVAPAPHTKPSTGWPGGHGAFANSKLSVLTEDETPVSEVLTPLSEELMTLVEVLTPLSELLI